MDKAVPFKGDTGDVEAELYRVQTPRDPLLLNRNRLCGTGRPLTFLLVWRGKAGHAVTIAPSTTAERPTNMDEICGTFNFVVK